jgi:hypothetical protein
MDTHKLKEDIEQFLTIPTADPRLVPKARDLMEALRSLASESQDLERYREISRRMAPAPKYSFVPPNFMYTVHPA